MAEDGTRDDEMKAVDRRARAGGGGRGRQSDPMKVDLKAVAPADLPPFQHPEGKKILPRHKRQAMKRAKALKLSPADANHALYLLLQAGYDPLEADNSLLSLATRQDKGAEAKGGGGGKGGAKGGSKELTVLDDPDEHNALTQIDRNARPSGPGAEDREAIIAKIQRDLVRRRRKRLVALVLRLAVFVFLPTAAVGYYYSQIATEMFETDSAFVIQTSDNPAGGGGLGGLLAGTGFATSQDSIVVQDYLTSREAFIRLEADHAYSEHFKSEEIDQIQRLDGNANLDEAFAYYQNKVTIGYDPTEGVIRMTVIGATPEASQRFSEALVTYAEDRVDGLTSEARGDQLADAIARYEKAEEDMIDAQQRVLTLQQQRGVLSAEVELTSQMGIINALELEKENKRLALAEILDNAQPSRARADVLEREITRLEDRIDELRADLTQTSDSSVSLARVGAELRIAETDLQTRQVILQESIAAMEAARLEANRQVRYLSLAVAPVAPVEATYPRKVESTILAFIVFAATYIMISLTASILREQVSV